MRAILPAVATIVVSLATGCGDAPDPRAAALANEKTPQKIVEQARDTKFESFRELCRAERDAIMAMVEYRRSIGGKPSTPEQVQRYSELMAAVKPFTDQIAGWFERDGFTDDDREALRFIHDVELAPSLPDE